MRRRGAQGELRVAAREDRFRAVVDDGRSEITRGDDDRPDVTIETNPATLAALVYDGLGIEEALRSGDLKIQGSKQAVERVPRPLLL